MLAALERTLGRHGLILRGGFRFAADEAAPSLPDGRRADTLLMVGNAGAAMWPAFSAAPEARDGAPDPLNRWSARVLTAVAGEVEAKAFFPFEGPPYHPFIAWAKRAEPVAESPLGILIHPRYGLWHAYRGALAFAVPIALPPAEAGERPCDRCADRPCLGACPVGAFTGTHYEVPRCVQHLSTPAGLDCMDLGCRARRACPVGQAYDYHPGQAAFHMAAFLDARKLVPSEP